MSQVCTALSMAQGLAATKRVVWLQHLRSILDMHADRIVAVAPGGGLLGRNAAAAAHPQRCSVGLLCVHGPGVPPGQPILGAPSLVSDRPWAALQVCLSCPTVLNAQFPLRSGHGWCQVAGNAFAGMSQQQALDMDFVMPAGFWGADRQLTWRVCRTGLWQPSLLFSLSLWLLCMESPGSLWEASCSLCPSSLSSLFVRTSCPG